MNPAEYDNCGNCEQPSLPQCSSVPLEKLKSVQAQKPIKVCSVKNCNIFGTHDYNRLREEYQCQRKSFKAKDENKNSLGSPIGLVASNVNFSTEAKVADITQAKFATYLKAFARLHLHEEILWNPLMVDDIMKEGLNLYTTSQEQKEEENSYETPSDIYTPNEMNIKRDFQLSGFSFHVELMPEFKMKMGNTKEESGAHGDAVALTLEDFKKAMRQFLRSRKYALITVADFYALIWHSRQAYFVFDVCGRRVTDFKSDKDKGVAMLICLSCLENVRHLVVNLSGLQETDPLSIRQIKVVKVVTPTGGIIQQDYAKRSHQYQVVNDDYAYLRSALHLTLNRRDLLRNRSALPVAITAIVCTKIDHPATWDMKMLDKIICFGVNFCQSVWAKCGDSEMVDVEEFPTYFSIGQFQITIEIIARQYEGLWHCIPEFKLSELAENCKRAFDRGDHKLIMQINYQIYAIWKKHDFIYLFDPFRHRIMGKPFESQVYEQMEKSASLRMFRSFDVFLNVFNHILMDSNRSSSFSLHAIKVRNIQKKLTRKELNLKAIEDSKLDSKGETISLNDHICFEEAEDICFKALADISDYEDEDLRSDVFEMELRTSSSEAEIVEEEEAMGEGEVEEIEGIETSSSGEEGGGHKKKSGKSGKAKGKGGKGGKGSKSKRGPSGKGKKGGGASDSLEGGDKKSKQKADDMESSEDEGKSDRKNKSKDKMNKNIKNRTKIKKEKSEDEEGHDEKAEKDKKLKEKEQKDEEGNVKKEKDKSKEQLDKDKETKDKNAKDKELKEKELKDKDKDLKDKEQKDKDLKDKLQKDKDQKGKDLKDKDIKDKDLKDKDLKDKDLKAKDAKDKEENDKDSKDKDQKDKDLKDRDQRDKDLKEKDLKDKELKDKQFKEKDLKEKDTKDIDQKDKELKDAKDKDKDVKLENMDDDKPEDQSKIATDKDKEGVKTDDEKDMGRKSRESKEEEILKSSQDEEAARKLEEAKAREKENALKRAMQEQEQTKAKIDFEQKPDKSKTPPHPYDDGTEADDENEEAFKKQRYYCSLPNPNCYPGYLKNPVDMAVLGSANGSYRSICQLLQSGFQLADRLLTLTPWGNFVIFRCSGKLATDEKHYYLYDGCTCNFERFRHLDLRVGTAGLLCFKHIHDIIGYIRQLRQTRRQEKKKNKYTAEEICQEYCNRSSSSLRL
ncbi:male sterile (3) 76Cc [Cochliomyia hominivorax]